MKFETEAVIIEITKGGSRATCRLKPVAEGSAIGIDGTKYLVGRQSPAASSPASIDGKLWPLDSAGLTQEFDVGDGLRQWARIAWQDHRKVRLVVDVQGKKSGITKITLL